VLTLSSLASPIKQQVLMTMTSASVSSSTKEYPSCPRIPSIFSASTRFLSQPRDMNNKFIRSFLSPSNFSKKRGKKIRQRLISPLFFLFLGGFPFGHPRLFFGRFPGLSSSPDDSDLLFIKPLNSC